MTVDLSSSPITRPITSPITTDSITTEAHQPKNFKFPLGRRWWSIAVFTVFNHLGLRNEIGCTTLRTSLVVCITCVQASAQKKLQWSSNLDLAFISNGFTNWKDATVKFSVHEASKCHKEVVLKMVTLPSSTKNMAESLSNALNREKFEQRQYLLKIFSNIRFLAQQGLPLRGHGDHETQTESDSNFV